MCSTQREVTANIEPAAMSNSSRTLVWVYGTLKAGFHNHAATGMHAAVLVGRATTIDRFPLLTLSPYRVPFMLDAAGVGSRVEGEVYEVDDVLLDRLDTLEGHPSWYLRREVKVGMEVEGKHNADNGAAPDALENTRIVHAYLLPPSMFNPSLLERPMTDFLSSYTLVDHQR